MKALLLLKRATILSLLFTPRVDYQEDKYSYQFMGPRLLGYAKLNIAQSIEVPWEQLIYRILVKYQKILLLTYLEKIQPRKTRFRVIGEFVEG